MSLFDRLVRLRAKSFDRPGPSDHFPPSELDDPFVIFGNEHVVNRLTGVAGVTKATLPIAPPVSLDPPPGLSPGAPPIAIESHYAKTRHATGFFDMDPIIPEGEVD